MTASLRSRVFGLTVGLLALGPWPCWAQPSLEVSESDARAAILYNLSRFVEWPFELEQASEPIVIATIGNRELFVALGALEDKTIRGRQIETRYFANAGKVRDCHVLHFDSSLLDSNKPPPSCSTGTLTVTTTDEALESGAAVAVWIKDGRLAFSMNLDAAREAGLKVSSKLLRLAERVVQEASE